MKLFVASDGGLAVVSADDNHYRCDVSLPGSSAQCVAVDPLQPRFVYCGTFGDGVWRSEDSGGTWQPAGPGITHAKVLSVAVSRTERADGRGVVYAGTEPSALFRSEDAGETWHSCPALLELPSSSEWSFPPRPETHHVRYIQPDPHAPGALFVAIEAGALVRSPDAGATWRDRTADSPYDTHQLAMPLSAPERMYSAAGDGFYESRDHGATWHKSEDGLRHTYMWNVAVDAGAAETLVVSAAASPMYSHYEERAESFIYRRTAGEPWQEVRAGLPDPAGRRTAVLAAHPREPGRFFAVWESDVFRSSDGGASWQRLDIAWPPHFEMGEPNALVVAAEE